jgi:hypothetical protein
MPAGLPGIGSTQKTRAIKKINEATVELQLRCPRIKLQMTR